MGYFTGLRLGDISRLRLNDLDIRDRRITIMPDKREARRPRPPLVIPMHPHLLTWFKLWRVDPQTAESSFVFPNLSKKKTQEDKGLSNTFTRLIEQTGIPNPIVREKVKGSTRSRAIRAYGFHSLRSTFNTELEAAGVKIEHRMKLSDHTSPEMNLRYTKPEWERLRKEVAKLPNL